MVNILQEKILCIDDEDEEQQQRIFNMKWAIFGTCLHMGRYLRGHVQNYKSLLFSLGVD